MKAWLWKAAEAFSLLFVIGLVIAFGLLVLGNFTVSMTVPELQGALKEAQQEEAAARQRGDTDAWEAALARQRRILDLMP